MATTCLRLLALLLTAASAAGGGGAARNATQRVSLEAQMPPYATRAGDAYLCTSLQLPAEPLKLVGVEALADPEVVHHILVFGGWVGGSLSVCLSVYLTACRHQAFLPEHRGQLMPGMPPGGRVDLRGEGAGTWVRAGAAGLSETGSGRGEGLCNAAVWVGVVAGGSGLLLQPGRASGAPDAPPHCAAPVPTPCHRLPVARAHRNGVGVPHEPGLRRGTAGVGSLRLGQGRTRAGAARGRGILSGPGVGHQYSGHAGGRAGGVVVRWWWDGGGGVVTRWSLGNASELRPCPAGVLVWQQGGTQLLQIGGKVADG